MKRIKNTYWQIVAGVTGTVLTASTAFATPTPVEELFSAVDISMISGLVKAMLIGFLGIYTLFVGYKFVKRTMFK